MRQPPTEQSLRARLRENLFPESAPTLRRLSRSEAALVGIALAVIAILFQLLRLGLGVSHDSIWAEDGPVLLGEALVRGTLETVGTEYAGYLIVVPRLIAELTLILPLHDAAAAISILSTAVVALSGFVVWHASSGQIRNPYLRGTLVLATVLAPIGGLETIASASYVSWYMLFASFWLLAWRPRSDLGAILGGLFILATALSNPGVWYFLPLALLRAASARDRRDATLLGAYTLGSLIQLRAVLTSSYESVEPMWQAKILGVLLQRVVDGFAFGLRLGGIAWSHLGWPFLVVLTVLVVVGFAFGLWRVHGPSRWLAAVTIPTAVLMFLVSVYQRNAAEGMFWPAHIWNGSAGRYSIVSVLLLISVAFAILDHGIGQGTPLRRLPLPAAAGIALVLISVAVSFPAGDKAARGTPSWSDSLDQAATVCQTKHPESTPVATSPPPFGLLLTCQQIEAR